MLRIPHSKYKIMPWQNGLGLTAEVDREPGGEGAYLWRLSQATIKADAPFSLFPGFDRWLAVWRGDAITLNDMKVAPLTPVRFSGDETTLCRLIGASVLDVGVIFDRAKVDAKMSVVEGPLRLPGSLVHYIFDLESGDTLKLHRATELTVGLSFLVSVQRIGG